MARVAHAGVELAWHAPAACPDETAMRAAIEQHLDAPPESIELAVSIDVVVAPGGFVAHVTTGDETRELNAATCAELADAVAVIAARTATQLPVAQPPPPKPAIATVAVPRPLVTAVVAPPVTEVPWNAGVRVAALAGSGFSPEPGMAGELAAWASYRRFSGELAAEHWWATTAAFGSTTGVEVGLTSLALRVGWAPVDHVRTWLVGEVGSQYGMGVGFDGASSGAGRRLAAGGGVGVSWPLAPHIAAVAAGEIEGTLERTSFALGMGATVYEAPRLAERLRLGLELSWR
jgi:hypothetical protein